MTHPVSRREILLGLSALTGGSALASAVTAGRASAAEQKSAKFILDWAFQGIVAPWTLAYDHGWFKEAGADISVSRGYGSGDTVAKVASGAFDLGYADTYTILRFMGENPDQKLISFFLPHDKSALSVVTMADSAIKTPKDLNGKTMGAPIGDASREVFPVFARLAGVDAASINWKTVSPDLRETVLIRKQADAVSGHIVTILLNLEGVGIPRDQTRTFQYADYGLPLYGHSLFCKPAYAEANPEVLKALIIGTVKGLRLMIKDPEAGVASIVKRDPLVNPKVELDRIKLGEDVMFVTPHVKQFGFGAVDRDRLGKTLTEVAKAYGIKRDITVDDIYTDKYLPAKADLAY